jgi:WD40 repeat protein
MHEHQRFVNCVRFSPNGDLAISVGSDKLAVLFDGQTGEKKVRVPRSMALRVVFFF